MKDIEAEMDEIQMIMKIWVKFYNILNTTFYNQDANMDKLDPEFQQVKQVVAEHHSHFMKVIKKDFHIGQSVLTTVKRTITLQGFQDLSPLEINKTLIEWHDANILLNETLGSLECERDMILRGRQKKSNIPVRGAGAKAKDFFQSSKFKAIFNLVIVLAIVIGLVTFWDPISQSDIYKNYLAWMIDPILKMVGLGSPDAPVTPPVATPTPLRGR
jgi:hypothetical protein